MRCGELATRYTFTYAVFTPTIRDSPTNQCVCARPAGINVPLLAAALDRSVGGVPLPHELCAAAGTSPRVVRHLSWRGGLLVPARTAQPLSRPLKDAHTHATRGGAPPPAHAGGIHTIHTTVALSRPRRPEDDSRRAQTPPRLHTSPCRHVQVERWCLDAPRRPSRLSRHTAVGPPPPPPPPQKAMLWNHFLLLRRPCSGTGRRPRAS
jgi:hypothetical protein